MIASALIAELRRDSGDNPKSSRVARQGDASTTLFNAGKMPILEGSYNVKRDTSALVENTGFSLDLDNGDLQTLFTPSAAQEVSMNFKYTNWRDKHWNDAINEAIQELNGRGFFRQVVRNTSIFRISASVRTYSAPSAAVSVYELLRFSDRTVSGSYAKLPGNWQYQQDANKIVLGYIPTYAERAAISYLRNMQTYNATSATLDVLTDWITLIKKRAMAKYYLYRAGQVAQQGSATIDEGHLSVTNLRALAKDLLDDFNMNAIRKKPTRPAMEIQYHVSGGGI